MSDPSLADKVKKLKRRARVNFVVAFLGILLAGALQRYGYGGLGAFVFFVVLAWVLYNGTFFESVHLNYRHMNDDVERFLNRKE